MDPVLDAYHYSVLTTHYHNNLALSGCKAMVRKAYMKDWTALQLETLEDQSKLLSYIRLE